MVHARIRDPSRVFFNEVLDASADGDGSGSNPAERTTSELLIARRLSTHGGTIRPIHHHRDRGRCRTFTPGNHPAEIVAIVDRMPRADRWRGYGYLFGYPDHAVDFFVEAGVAADDGRAAGPGKDREFVHIPTHATDSGRFTYAVPLDHVPTIADRRLAERAGLILAAYEERRARMLDPRRTAEELLRLNARFEPFRRTGAGPVR
ncbi:hypothetical protein OAG62_00715 [bacterium]|nr:hypothetical protein [bacterium]